MRSPRKVEGGPVEAGRGKREKKRKAFGMEPASTATSEDPNPPKAFFPFSAAPLQPDDQKTKKRSSTSRVFLNAAICYRYES
ncbi:hypothetical protein T458_23590 [Brevibacillus panacihumi W25]|uniref:Uncharacterized protein n=1 Tax=Brevibacillus panacihumi W25 TaxID=1408254 RepID=V6M7X1_9BACL|nr:hypothetical protein T458_23590 [Brevibacillus panacihumi W25]